MVEADLNGAQLRELFGVCCRALTCDALRLKPRERQFALLLATESFREGSDSGRVGVSFPVRGVPQTGSWCGRLSDWRPGEIWEMLQNWRRAGWLAVDEAEGKFRLAPDRLPGWADVIRLLEEQIRQPAVLPLVSDEDVHKGVARISQAQAVAKLSHSKVARFSQPLAAGGPGAVVPVPTDPNVSETFNRLTSERLNVERSRAREACENFARGEPGRSRTGAQPALPERVRAFVGEHDWLSANFWNAGRGWRARLFSEEGAKLAAALDVCEAGLAAGEIRIRKTRGAMLWDEFQRQRQEVKA